jgi:hypothetical protein
MAEHAATASKPHAKWSYSALKGPFAYLADNEYIKRGYRLNYSWWQCVKR